MSGLPNNVDAERLVIGSVLLDDEWFHMVQAILSMDDFSLEKHRRIFSRISQIAERNEKIDRITLANELMKFGELESVDGLSYLVSLDDGLPLDINVEAYCRIVKEKATLRRIVFANQHSMNRALQGEETADEILGGLRKTISDIEDTTGKLSVLTPGEIMKSDPGGIQGFLQPPQGGGGLQTPWPKLTRRVHGFKPGELVLIGGRPGMGKSIIGMQMAHHIAHHHKEACVVFSLEMSKKNLIQRTLSAVASVSFEKFISGYMNAEERHRVAEAATQIADYQILVDDSRARTVSRMLAVLHRVKKRWPLKMVVIDHLQLIKPASNKNISRHDQVSEISHELKLASEDFEVTIVLLSQLNRDCERENRPPQLSDLKESGTIEEDADVVMFVHRPERYSKNFQREDLRAHAEFILAKQRNGAIGKMDMLFQDTYQRFEEPTERDIS